MDLFEAIEGYGDLLVEATDADTAVEATAKVQAANELLVEIRDEYSHSGRSPMPTEFVYRMQGLVVQFAGFDLEGRRNADELDLMHNEAGSVKRAIEAWYEQNEPEGGAS